MPNKKFESICVPYVVWRTSGWNCVAYKLRSAHSIEATGHALVLEVMENPWGTFATESRWLIHTVCSSGVPSSKREGATRVMAAGPYSPISVCPTTPPSVLAMICWP